MTTDSGLMTEIDKVVDDYMARGLAATENANTSWGPNGLLFAVGGHMLELHYLKEMRAAGHGELADLHGQGYVHIHDLSLGKFTPYCCGHSLQNLLETGLRAGFIRSSRPATCAPPSTTSSTTSVPPPTSGPGPKPSPTWTSGSHPTSTSTSSTCSATTASRGRGPENVPQ